MQRRIMYRDRHDRVWYVSEVAQRTWISWRRWWSVRLRGRRRMRGRWRVRRSRSSTVA